MISIVHQLGAEPKVTERRSLIGELDSVEVQTPAGQDDPSESIVFYREQATCDAERASNAPIRSDYK